MEETGGAKDVRLGELLAALSLATDLGNAFPLEKALRNCLIATRIGEELALARADLSDTYYAAMLRFIGCTAYAYEAGRRYGDDNAVRNVFAPVDFGFPKDVMRVMLKEIGKDRPPLQRARMLLGEIATGKKTGLAMAAADCDVVVRLSNRLHMSPTVGRALAHMFERWDGKGEPGAIAGEAIELAARIAHVAHEAEIHARIGGPDAAVAFVRRGRGGWFDPAVADAFLRRADDILAEAAAESVWDIVLGAEPLPYAMLEARRIDDIARAFADFADLKSPYTLGHSTGVAEIAEAAARACGLGDDDAVDVRRAALLHDLGRVSVSNGIWDKKGKLTTPEWERVRLHSYYSERILSQTAILRPLAALAGMHHERLDASGYHRGAPAAMQSTAARILAAADVFQALTEDRPHRAATAPEVAAKEIQGMADAGALDRDAVRAVCAAAGHAAPQGRRAWPAGLTDREVEVLRLLAKGHTKKEIAKALFISPGTAHTHVVHISEKAGVVSRAGAALFAVENDLLRD